jgi:hypothetical protein
MPAHSGISFLIPGFIQKLPMIKRILLAGSLFLALESQAQLPEDALRYSWLTPNGTARSTAFGGALTALGGDLQSVYVNPAGLGQFKTSEMVLTPGFNFSNNKANYLGSSEKDSKSGIAFGTSGFIFGSPRWQFGLAVSQSANFKTQVAYNGVNNQSSYSEKYLEELISNNVTDPNAAAQNYPYGSSLAVNTYLVEPELDNDGNATGYYSLATPNSGVKQEQQITTSGGITSIGLAASRNFNDKFFVGGSMTIDYLQYKRDQTFKESDNTENATNNFKYFTSNETLETSGEGISLRLGMIYKPVETIRIGLAFHTPTFYNLKDVYTTTVTTDLEGYAGPGELHQSSTDLVGSPGEYNYSFNNPMRVMAGFSYVLREVNDVTHQKGFLSIDVEYLNYGSGKFVDDINSGSAGYFDDLNSTIKDIYKNALNVRLGGELKFNIWMVRAGFGYFSNPYKDVEFKANKMNLSGGVGYRNKGIFVDLTYVHQLAKDSYYPYRLESGYYAPANIKSGIGNVVATVGFKF